MELDIIEHDKAIIVSVTGKLDVRTSPELEKFIFTNIKVEKPLILNFNGLNYISSAGLRVVLLSAKQLKANKQSLLLSGLKGTVKDVFELSGFYSIFKIFELAEDAVASL